MGSKKNVDMSATQDTVKIVKAKDDIDQQGTSAKSVTPKKRKSPKYLAKKSLVDRTKDYVPSEAIDHIKRLSYTSFDGTITAHFTVKEEGTVGSITLPHSTGKTRVIAVVNDAVVKELEDGIVNFDVLISTPQDMKKITKYARLLGPKGLMPNPKNGTVTPNPEVKKKELEGGAMVVKTQRKMPVCHVTIGKVSASTDHLTENLEMILKTFKGKVTKMNIAATMSPSVRVVVSE